MADGVLAKLRLKPTRGWSLVGRHRVTARTLEGHHRSVHPPAREAPMATPNIETIIRDRVTLTVDCIDRLYLNGYVPTLQTSGQLCWYLKEHLGNPIPSPALLRPLHDRFVRDVTTFATSGGIPVVQFERGQRK